MTDDNGDLDDWRTIDSAPRDGTEFLAAEPRGWYGWGAVVVWWDESESTFISGYKRFHTPSHWKPLGPWPKAKEASK